MKHSIEVTGYAIVAFLSFVLFLSGFKPPAKPTTPATLGVPLVPQIGTCWCWAACSEMVSRYYNSVNPANPILTQCQAVQMAVDSTMPCPQTPPVPAQWDQNGIPFTEPNDGYTWKSYTGTIRVNGAIPYDSLAAEFAAGRPVIFQWQWVGISVADSTKNGLHFLVAEGIPKERFGWQWVSVNDPMPYTMGHHRVMSYYSFANVIGAQAQPGDKRGDEAKTDTYNKNYQFNAHAADLIRVRPDGSHQQ